MGQGQTMRQYKGYKNYENTKLNTLKITTGESSVRNNEL